MRSIYILTLNLVLLATSLVLELIFLQRNPSLVWLTGCLQGLGQSTVLPASLTWLQELVWVNSRVAGKRRCGIKQNYLPRLCKLSPFLLRVSGVLMCSASIGMVVVPGVVGFLMDSRDPRYFILSHLVCVAVMCCIFVLLNIAVRCLGKKTYFIFLPSVSKFFSR